MGVTWVIPAAELRTGGLSELNPCPHLVALSSTSDWNQQVSPRGQVGRGQGEVEGSLGPCTEIISPGQVKDISGSLELKLKCYLITPLI